MIIKSIIPQPNWTLQIIADNGKEGVFDLSSYLKDEAFEPLKNVLEFNKVVNKGYFIEWECGADLSADTIEARMVPVKSSL